MRQRRLSNSVYLHWLFSLSRLLNTLALLLRKNTFLRNFQYSVDTPMPYDTFFFIFYSSPFQRGFLFLSVCLEYCFTRNSLSLQQSRSFLLIIQYLLMIINSSSSSTQSAFKGHWMSERCFSLWIGYFLVYFLRLSRQFPMSDVHPTQFSAPNGVSDVIKRREYLLRGSFTVTHSSFNAYEHERHPQKAGKQIFL